MVHTVPFGVTSPVLLQDAAGYRIIDAKKAAEFKKTRLVKLVGQKFCKLSDGTRRFLEVFLMRRTAETPAFMGGESARMTPSRPTHGSVWQGTYARRLSGLVAGHKEAEEIFKAWRPKMKLAPTPDNADIVNERAILFFPTAGLTAKERREIYGARSS